MEVVGADMSEDGLRLAVLPAAVDTYIGLKPFSLFPGDDDVLLTGLVQARNRGSIIIQYPPDYKSRSFTRDETKVLIRTQAIRPKAVQQLRPEDVEIIDIKMGQVPLEFKRMIVPQKATARLS